MKNVLLLKTRTVPTDPYHDILSKHNIAHHFIPLLTHKHLPDECVKKFQQDHESIDYLIITSQRAVEALQQSILTELDSEVVEYLFSRPIFTVGPATAVFLQNVGFTNIKGGNEAGNGSILADIISNEEDGAYKNKTGLFLVGEIRKDVIPRKLIPAGFNLTELVVYTTTSMDNIAERYFACLKPDCNNIVVFFSPQGTEEIVKSIGNDLSVLCIGPTTEEYLLSKNIKVDGVCEKPSAEALLKLLI
ncbi:hypothetical protein QEN19_001446 [Hanseniaspora menglaensis]